MADKYKGAITLLRDIQTHWLWKDKPFDKARAWIDMLLLATHQKIEVACAGKIEVLNRGELILIQTDTAKRWGWSRQKLRDFFALLSHPNPDLPMIKCQNLGNRATKITILNYNELQKLTTNQSTNREPTENQPRTNQPTSHKNVKNVKNDKNKYKSLQTTTQLRKPQNLGAGNAEQAKQAEQTFVAGLKANLAYQDIDVDAELGKMDAWLSARPGRKKTKRFIVNWLNRVEKPLDAQQNDPFSGLILNKPL